MLLHLFIMHLFLPIEYSIVWVYHSMFILSPIDIYVVSNLELLQIKHLLSSVFLIFNFSHSKRYIEFLFGFCLQCYI